VRVESLPTTGTISQFGVQAFNEELDKMYEDINLPEDQAWAAMINDLRKAKETRNLFAKENQQLKRKLQALEQENEEYAFIVPSMP
jgi:RNA polymerase-interacting CarD/CdnL/TRCF family regulator